MPVWTPEGFRITRLDVREALDSIGVRTPVVIRGEIRRSLDQWPEFPDCTDSELERLVAIRQMTPELAREISKRNKSSS